MKPAAETATAKQLAKTRKERNRVKRVENVGAGVASGAVAGAAAGVIAGPPGAIAGAVIGAVAGAAAGVALTNDGEREVAEDEALDREIGVTEGSLGAPSLKHPPAKVGAFSAGSAGGGSSGNSEAPAEGTMPPPSRR
ncbi:MAG TPA: hypothetical protein VF407_23360 [Polyangiaceae bacterium]